MCQSRVYLQDFKYFSITDKSKNWILHSRAPLELLRPVSPSLKAAQILEAHYFQSRINLHNLEQYVLVFTTAFSLFAREERGYEMLVCSGH